MSPRQNLRAAFSRIDAPMRMALVYAAFSAVWIVASDWLVVRSNRDTSGAWRWEMGKGLLFVAVTTLLLYQLARRAAARQAAAAAALRESQLRWQFAVEGAEEGIWDCDLATGKTYFSRQWKAILGYNEEEIGDDPKEWDSRVHPEDYPRVQAEIARHLAGETPSYHAEYRIRAKDGMYRWILGRGKVVSRLPDGRPWRLIGTHMDITDRKRGEQRTADSLAFARAILRSSPMGIIAYGPDGSAALANEAAARMIGTDVTGLLRQNFRNLESWRRNGLLADAERALGTGVEVAHSGPILTTFGRSLWVECRLVGFQYAGERHLLVLLHDLSEHKSLERQLARAQRMESIGLLASGIAHDLNNVLAPIMLAIGLVRMRNTDPETADHLGVIESAAQRGAGVVRQVLTFARGVEGERIALDVRHLVKDLAHLAEETFPREIQVRCRSDEDLPAVIGDLTQIHQALLNLALNARDAMPGGGILSLDAARAAVDAAQAARQIPAAVPGDYVRLGVRDTGTGISPEVLEHMFEPFFTTKPRGKGSGLGLATVFGIVRSHRGFIEVDTEVGKGTTFSLFLPAAKDEAPARGAESPPPLRGDGRRILVVDDEPAIRDITGRILSRHGFAPTEAKDGVEALAIFDAAPAAFSAVILDLMMPTMDGYQLARELRRRSAAIPLLASTGMAGDATVVDAPALLRKAGVRTLLQKPYTEAQLVEALARELRPAPAAGASNQTG